MYAHIGTNIIICTCICMYFRGDIMGVKKDFILQVRLNEYELELLDKYARATPIATAIENERVFFRKDASWLYRFQDNIPGFEEQLTGFPNKNVKAMVDCLAYSHDMDIKLTVAEMLNQR